MTKNTKQNEMSGLDYIAYKQKLANINALLILGVIITCFVYDTYQKMNPPREKVNFINNLNAIRVDIEVTGNTPKAKALLLAWNQAVDAKNNRESKCSLPTCNIK